MPRGRHQVPLPAEPRESAITAPDTVRRTALAAVGAGAMFLPAARVADSLDVNYHSKVIRPPGRGRGARVPRALHPLRRVHEGVPEQRAAPGVLRGGDRGDLDADPHRAHRLLRVLVRALRAGLPDRRHPEDHREGEARASASRPSRSAPRSTTRGAACRGRCRRRASCARSSARRLPRPSGSRRSTRRFATASRARTATPPAYKTVHLQRPHVDPSLCVGCGACEKVCPVQDQPAVYVTSVGETRSKTNVILLENTNYNQKT